MKYIQLYTTWIKRGTARFKNPVRVGNEKLDLFIRLNTDLKRVFRLDGIPVEHFRQFGRESSDGKLVYFRIHIRRFPFPNMNSAEFKAVAYASVYND